MHYYKSLIMCSILHLMATKCNNGHVGPFKSVVNMGPVEPPQQKGRLALYAGDKLIELQSKFDELEKLGVFLKQEDAGMVIEYLNPSFLIRKRSGRYRLVTAFAEVGRYSKLQPTLMPDMDSTLHKIACWKCLITSDLTNAFYQIPLAKQFMKYCGVMTPLEVFAYTHIQQWACLGRKRHQKNSCAAC